MTNKRIKEKQAEIPEELLPGYEWETSGGKAKRIKEGKPIKKRVYQEPLPERSKFIGGGRAQRGYGKAYLKGGRVK